MLSDHYFEKLLKEAVVEWQKTDEYECLPVATRALVDWLAVNAEVRNGLMHGKTSEIMRVLEIGSTQFETTKLGSFIRESTIRHLKSVFN